MLFLAYSSAAYSQDEGSDEVYKLAEEMPYFDGCDTKACSDERLIDFIQSNVKYPKKDRKKGVQGRVFVQFVIEKDGSTSSYKVVRGLSPTINKEAIKVVRKFPTWVPGRIRGEPVRVMYTLPMTFMLPK